MRTDAESGIRFAMFSTQIQTRKGALKPLRPTPIIMLNLNRTLSGKPTSLWLDTTAESDFPPLQNGLTVDVAIIGGGIAGLTAATLLKASGKTVAVLESRRIVQGVTGYTTAKITSLHTLDRPSTI